MKVHVVRLVLGSIPGRAYDKEIFAKYKNNSNRVIEFVS